LLSLEICSRKNKMATEKDLLNWFAYHPPAKTQIPKFTAIREAALAFSRTLLENTPPSADQTAALRQLRECVMTANAAIACESPSVNVTQLGDKVTFGLMFHGDMYSMMHTTVEHLEDTSNALIFKSAFCGQAAEFLMTRTRWLNILGAEFLMTRTRWLNSLGVVEEEFDAAIARLRENLSNP